jgi:hypothetical protein
LIPAATPAVALGFGASPPGTSTAPASLAVTTAVPAAILAASSAGLAPASTRASGAARAGPSC